MCAYIYLFKFKISSIFTVTSDRINILKREEKRLVNSEDALYFLDKLNRR